jgi:hypothetical protein
MERGACLLNLGGCPEFELAARPAAGQKPQAIPMTNLVNYMIYWRMQSF